MALNDLVEVLKHASFMAAVLAGFAVTLFVGILTNAPKRWTVNWAAGAALLAASLLGVASIAGTGGIIAAILDPDSATGSAQMSTVVGAFQWATWSFLLGMASFMISLGISGWIRSVRLGIVSSSIAVGTILSLVYFITSVVRGF